MKKRRLEEIINLVEDNSIVADIGTDHGIVPYELIKSNKAKKVIASDISEKSLDKLREKLDYLDEPEKIILNVSDGLDNLNEYQVDTIIISGMGGNLIVDILNKNIDVAKSANCLILGANNSLSVLRKFLHDNSFEIIEEVDLFENDKYYQIIKIKVGKQLFSNDYEYEFGKFLIDNKSENLKQYIKQQIENKKTILSNISEKDSDNVKNAIDNINVEIKELEKVLNKIEA
ncbi:SAM-dependent methyltransferase [Finegoldia magna]|uniref:SAM-dependent methyltransferase n=1 Tax=Finegoldia magna TaxID=1260 RepID=A0A233VIY7_FINMA|nr:class I SAM-dependent methyltransferase [Finegoldia magna]MDU5368455.1 class I SAM-dependent methyltransferase [Finegoldia magna]MDU5444075.1 class I SAM-dependent methyltransferase [Finegoldia magna]MDU7384312.1 class I SAM-dependent methyltransferase [Finegoldia magna]OXZ32358.1 SAM-dependent methyltransferase [Finegoldia magna]PMC59391.1 SAM-dependent methyltransferase [Finegoldia magna]